MLFNFKCIHFLEIYKWFCRNYLLNTSKTIHFNYSLHHKSQYVKVTYLVFGPLFTRLKVNIYVFAVKLFIICKCLPIIIIFMISHLNGKKCPKCEKNCPYFQIFTNNLLII